MNLFNKTFSTYSKLQRKVTSNSLKSKQKNVSSHEWLSRQLSDPYIEKAKQMSYRCRSAFKLLEIDDKYKILKPGDVVIDVGASPGSWSQVIVNRINSKGDKDLPKGTAIAIDKQNIYPLDASAICSYNKQFYFILYRNIPHYVVNLSLGNDTLHHKGVTIFGNMDFTKPESQQKLINFLEGKSVNAVLSDMAPSTTGIKEMDKEIIIDLCYNVLRFSLEISEKNASLLVKLWQCKESKQLETNIAKFYNKVKVVKPDSSRSDSAEIFLLGREFKGLRR